VASASADPKRDSGAPLSGRSVIVTRTREQAAELAEPLEALGAEVLAFPVIEVVDPEDWAPVDAAIEHLADYDWIVLTSANAVERFFERIREIGGDRHALAAARFAVVGSATAARLRSHGFEPALIPADFRAEGLIEEFERLALDEGIGAGEGWRVLVPRALEAREILLDALRDLGCAVDVAPVYRTIAVAPDPAVLERLRAGTVDAVTFTSGSTVRNFVTALQGAGLDPAETMDRLVVASIGPVTTASLRKRGYDADVEASESTMSALANALARALATSAD